MKTYPEVMHQGSKITTAFIEMIYEQARSKRPITFSNVLFVTRHPVFTLQMLWFTAKLLGVLTIDNENLKKIYGV